MSGGHDKMTSETVKASDNSPYETDKPTRQPWMALRRLISPITQSWYWVLGFNSPGYIDPRTKLADFDPLPGQVRYAELITKQIEVEQGLANTRMMWNLTFQGFTIAGYALVASSNGATPAKMTLETLIAVASAIIAYATLRGVVASQIQRQYLKDCWTINDLDRFFAQPFSISHTSSRGRLPSYSICLALIFMWGALLYAQFRYPGDNDPVTRVQIVPPAPAQPITPKTMPKATPATQKAKI